MVWYFHPLERGVDFSYNHILLGKPFFELVASIV